MPSVDFTPLSKHPEQAALTAFAAANGWEFLSHIPRQGLPGVIFREPGGTPRTSQIGSSIVRMGGEPWTEVGNSAWLDSVQLGPFAVRWGYLAVRVATGLPHVIVTTPGADRLPSLPPAEYAQVPDGAPGVRVYTAPHAREWASRAFPPSVLTLLADPALPLSVEVSEGWLLVYAPGTLSTTDAATWQRILAVRDALARSVAAAGTPPTTGDDALPMDAAAPPLREQVTPQVRTRRTVLIGVPVLVGAAVLTVAVLSALL